MTKVVNLKSVLGFVVAFGLATAASAASVSLSGTLAGAESDGSGTVTASYDTATMEFKYTIEYEGLSGPPGAIHFHGPAAPGANAGVALPVDGDLTSPISGSATLNDDQANQLLDGMWYLNVHTAKVRAGEVRAQITTGM